MIYVMSDLHGDYERYAKMLDVIGLDEEKDTLYVLGDVLDYGGEGLRILSDMSARPNVFPVIGEHEYMALPLLDKLKEQLRDGDAVALNPSANKAFLEWGKNGGQETVREFWKLSPDDRDWLIEYLEEFAPYEEVTVGGTDYVLVHAGLGDFSAKKELDDYDLEDLITGKPDYEKIYFADKILVTGHTPTVEINPAYKGKIFSLNNHIAVDCGAMYGLPLGCIRLDDGKEFYVE